MPIAAVQAAGGLVGQADRRRVHQRAPDGNTLLLAARKLVGQVGPALLKSQHLRRSLAALIDLAPVHQDGQGDVLHYVQRGIRL